MSAERVLASGDDPAPAVVARAALGLRRGELLIYPTDTLYALGGRALDAAVARRVRAAKGRTETKPLPLVAASEDQARDLCAEWPEAARRLAASFWPGPLSLVLRAAARVPGEVTAGGGTLAVRVPSLPLTRALCEAAGPLISTSANRAGEPAASTCLAAIEAVGDAATLALDAGPLGARPSSIVDLTGERPRLLRQGAVAWEDVERALR